VKRADGPSPQELRRRAEDRLAKRETSQPAQAPDPRSLQAEDPRRLLHELQVHQIELEMQNEELLTTRTEVEAGLQRYTELFDFAPIGYLVLDSEDVVREANLEAARMLGRARRTLAGLTFARFVDPSQQAAWAGFLAGVFAGRAEGQPSETCELALVGAGPAELQVRVDACCLSGEKPRAVVAIQDITARNAAERARQEESTRKDEFMAALSHELRNPLAPIRSGLSVLERVSHDGEASHKALAIVDRQVNHLIRLVDDLLDVTRIARGKIRLQREPLQLGELVQHTMDDQRADFEAHGVALDAALSTEPLWIDADPARMVQVVGNLLTNAMKFTPRGGRVEVALRGEGSHTVLTVRDNGVGIPSEVHETLFEPFVQAPQTLERTRGGLGLGLAMVKGLVELQGGTVDAVSAGAGKGSEFVVRLPLTTAPRATVQPAESTPQVASRRVLVIEDNVDSADTLQELLELDGHDVQVAYDGSTGLKLARTFHPEIVLCDVGLPGMDGYGVCREMRADLALRGAYLVALSGYARQEDRDRAAEAGFDRHVAKPPSMTELRRVMAKARPQTTSRA